MSGRQNGPITVYNDPAALGLSNPDTDRTGHRSFRYTGKLSFKQLELDDRLRYFAGSENSLQLAGHRRFGSRVGLC